MHKVDLRSVVSDEKKNRIKASLAATREKRKLQTCKVYSLKIDQSHLNAYQRYWLSKVFLEAKWFFNHSLSQKDVFSFDTKTKNVLVKNREGISEWRKLEVLSSQMKCAIWSRILDTLKGLSNLKRNGHSVGRIRFAKNVDSIPLPQFNNTWKFAGNRIHVQGLKKTFSVMGLEQIPGGVDFANAVLMRKVSGYYFLVTTFQKKETRVQTGKSVGLDFGIKDNVVTSDGEKFNAKVSESDRLKRLQRRFAKKLLGSKQRRKLQVKIAREYERIGNQKKDHANKIVSHLAKAYDHIFMQDEMIKQWHSGLFGKQVQHSALGAIKARLKTLESVQVIDRRVPTTKMCYRCGKVHSKVPLAERVFRCDCGLEEDRDVKSAKTVLMVGRLKIPGMEHTSTPPEGMASTKRKQGKLSPVKEEATKYCSR